MRWPEQWACDYTPIAGTGCSIKRHSWPSEGLTTSSRPTSRFHLKFSTSRPLPCRAQADSLARWPGGLIRVYGMDKRAPAAGRAQFPGTSWPPLASRWKITILRDDRRDGVETAFA